MQALLNAQQAYFKTNQTRSIDFRRLQLQKLAQAIKNRESDIQAALKADLNKSEFEAYATEIGYCLSSIQFALKHLKHWTKTKKVKTPLSNFPSQSFIQMEPLGSILIIGPYNYPFQLIIEPLIGAIAAGNTVLLKPSEYAQATSTLLQIMIQETFDENYIAIVLGDAEIAKTLVKLPFNHIFFTGGTRVGKAVYQMAAESLIPVTLELGGKSPTIVDETADLEFAARRIVFGKFINAGQTCIAPDYIYAHASIKTPLIEALKRVLEKHQESQENFTRIIHHNHFKRLLNLIDAQKLVYSKPNDASKLYFSPHILDNVTEEDVIMKEEIFGPILPILSYENLDDLISLLKDKEHALALYLFSKNKQTQKRIFTEISFGNGAINDTIMQVSNPHLPFGGVGQSGIGAYHGYSSFERFSHKKSFTKRFSFFDPDMLYPPYSKHTLKLIKHLLK